MDCVDDWVNHTGAELRALLGSGQLRVEELARACLDRIGEREPVVQAWAYLQPDLVLARARELDLTQTRGPLFGLPVAVKDVILTKDMPTQYNSSVYEGFYPHMDAACVALLRAAGAVVFGKTATVEFAATGKVPSTVNPRNTHHTPGGSSSGSAAAVADRHVPLSLGTQTGGSIIRPASFCGVWAVKPSWNSVSTEGVKVFSASLDTVGWFGRSAQDLALLYSALMPAWRASPDLDIHRSRIAICRTPLWHSASGDMMLAIECITSMLQAAGAHVEELCLSESFDTLPADHLTVMRMEGRRAFYADAMTYGDHLSPAIRMYVDNHWSHVSHDLVDAVDRAAVCREEFDALASAYDAVIAPSALGEAPVGLENTGDLAFNGIWTLLQVPCVNVPGFCGSTGLPVGLSVIGPRHSDGPTLAAAEAIGRVLQDGIAATS